MTEDKLADGVKAKLSEKIEVTLTVTGGTGSTMTATADKDSKDIAQAIKDGKTVNYVAAHVKGVNIYFKNPSIEEDLSGDKSKIVTALAVLVYIMDKQISDKQPVIGYMVHNGTDVTLIQGDVLMEHSVTGLHLESGAVDTDKLADGAVTPSKLDVTVADHMFVKQTESVLYYKEVKDL